MYGRKFQPVRRAELRDVLAERPQSPGARDDVLVVGHEQAALAAGQDLARVEAVAADDADRPDLAALVGRAVRLTGVLDDVQAMPVGDVEDLVEVARAGRWIWTAMMARVRGPILRLDLAGIEVVRPRVDVDEDRDAELLEDRLPRPGERERGRDDLVAGLEADAVQRRMDRGGAGVEQEARRSPDERRPLVLEGGQSRGRPTPPRIPRSRTAATAARSSDRMSGHGRFSSSGIRSPSRDSMTAVRPRAA